MKIAMIGQKGIPVTAGGIEVHVYKISKALTEKGHQVYVYNRFWYSQCSQKKFEGINLVLLPTIRTKHLDAISHTFISTIHALFQDYDVIHYHGVGPSLLCWIPRLFKPKVKVISTFHCIDRQHKKWGGIAQFFLKLGEYFSVKFAHQTITVSRSLANYCQKSYHKNTVYIPNGVDVLNIDGQEFIEKKFGLIPKKYLFGVSRLVRHKGYHHLFKAYKSIKTDLPLVIAGDPSFTDDYLAELEKMASEDKRIQLLHGIYGEVKDKLIANSLLFIHPSEVEGLPIVVLEALGFGTPVLASDIPEHQEVVSNPKFLFQSKNVLDLQQKLEFLLNNIQLLEVEGKNRQEFVKKDYNWEDIVKQLIEIYQK